MHKGVSNAFAVNLSVPRHVSEGEAPIWLSGPPSVSVTLRRSAQARRLSLRVSRLDGRVTLTMPHGAPRRLAEEFAQERADWIRDAVADIPLRETVAEGTALPVEGQTLVVTRGARGQVDHSAGQLVIAARSRSAGSAARGVLRALARDRLAAASDYYAAELGRPYARLTLRDTRSRWGSCTSNGALMYSWRLIMAPRDVLDYVAAHEVAHLAEMNHSKAFWDVVAQLYPAYVEPRQWLRDHGADLHRFDFTAGAD